MRLVCALLAVLSLGCAWKYPPKGPAFRPEAPHATPDLSGTAAPSDGREAPFELRFYPAMVNSGGATWMTCYVPSSWPRTARLVMAFEGKFAAEMPIEDRGPRLVENIPCGVWTGVCEVYIGNGQRRTARNTLEAGGGCK